MATSKNQAPHLVQLLANLRETQRLMEIHTEVAGEGRGRKHDVEVLNKSAIVLAVACWEAFVEDLAELALKAIVDGAKDHTVVAPVVLERVASRNTGMNAWRLAGDGWKDAIRDNYKEVLAKTTGALNTPRAPQVDELFVKTIGLVSLSSHWHWPGRSAKQAISALDKLVTLRGSIAHRVSHSQSVTKREVKTAIDLVARLAIASNNVVRKFVHERTKIYPWLEIT